MINLPNNDSLKRGLLLFNVTPEVTSYIIEHLQTTYNAKSSVYDQSTQTLDEATKAQFYETYNLPEDQRVSTVLYMNQETLVSSAEQVIPLIMEARPLKIIVVVGISDVTQLPDELQDVLFGNVPNFVFGTLPSNVSFDLTSRLGDGVEIVDNSIAYLSEPDMVREQIALH